MDIYIEHLWSIITSFTKCIDLKIFISCLIAIFAFLFDINQWEILAGLLVLIMFDFITGIFAAKMSGEMIQSSKAVRSAFKMFVYCIIIASGHLVDKAVGITNWIFTAEYAIYVFLSATEAISIFENAGRMGFNTPKKLLNTLKHYTCEEIEDATVKTGCK